MFTFGGWAACREWVTCAAGMLELQGRVGASECFDDQGFGPDTVAECLFPDIGQQLQTGVCWPFRVL